MNKGQALMIVKAGWAKILVGFYEFLKTEKGFQLPDGTGLVDEWVDRQAQRTTSTLDAVLGFFKSNPQVGQVEEEEPEPAAQDEGSLQ